MDERVLDRAGWLFKYISQPDIFIAFFSEYPLSNQREVMDSALATAISRQGSFIRDDLFETLEANSDLPDRYYYLWVSKPDAVHFVIAVAGRNAASESIIASVGGNFLRAGYSISNEPPPGFY